MEFVQPIRDMNKIKELKQILFKQNYRDYFMFVLGINSGLRISDILRLRVSDVRNKSHIVIKEKKTGKEKRFKINSFLKNEIMQYIKGKKDDDYLFPSRQGRGNRALSRVMAYILLTKAAKQAGLAEIGTHSLRKTFGYHFYKKTKDITLLQNIFNHSNPAITLRYIGINQDILDNAIDQFSL